MRLFWSFSLVGRRCGVLRKAPVILRGPSVQCQDGDEFAALVVGQVRVEDLDLVEGRRSIGDSRSQLVSYFFSLLSG
jgi:hypothetical protein